MKHYRYYRNMPNEGAGRDSKVQSDDMVKVEVLCFPTVVSDWKSVNY